MTVTLKRDAILLHGGPLDAHGFYKNDFETLKRAERWAGRETCDHYVYVRREIHPQTGGKNGGQESERWEWRPPGVAQEPGLTVPAAQPAVSAPAPSRVQHVRAVVSMAGPRGLSVAEVVEKLRMEGMPDLDGVAHVHRPGRERETFPIIGTRVAGVLAWLSIRGELEQSRNTRPMRWRRPSRG